MFPCTMCGICCQNISHIKELESFDLGNGVCKYFDLITKGCTIYDIRPNICRIDKMYELEYYKKFTKSDFYNLNAEACNRMQESYKIENKFRIKIGE